MPFQSGLDILKQIATLVQSQINRDEKLNADIKKETMAFTKKMQALSTEIYFIYNKLQAYQLLQTNCSEIHDLKDKSDKLFANLKNLNIKLIDIQITYNEMVFIRVNYKNKWYSWILCCCNCKFIYSKTQFIADIILMNEQIQTQIDTTKKVYDDLETLMEKYFRI